MPKVIDRKTGKELHTGDTLIRKDYKGFKHRYELLDLNMGSHMVRVRKLLQDDSSTAVTGVANAESCSKRV